MHKNKQRVISNERDNSPINLIHQLNEITVNFCSKSENVRLFY